MEKIIFVCGTAELDTINGTYLENGWKIKSVSPVNYAKGEDIGAYIVLEERRAKRCRIGAEKKTRQ